MTFIEDRLKSQLKHKQKIIDDLVEENKLLKEQLKSLDYDEFQVKKDLVESMMKEYSQLINELNDLKKEYEEINREALKAKGDFIQKLNSLY